MDWYALGWARGLSALGGPSPHPCTAGLASWLAVGPEHPKMVVSERGKALGCIPEPLLAQPLPLQHHDSAAEWPRGACLRGVPAPVLPQPGGRRSHKFTPPAALGINVSSTARFTSTPLARKAEKTRVCVHMARREGAGCRGGQEVSGQQDTRIRSVRTWAHSRVCRRTDAGWAWGANMSMEGTWSQTQTCRQGSGDTNSHREVYLSDISPTYTQCGTYTHTRARTHTCSDCGPAHWGTLERFAARSLCD